MMSRRLVLAAICAFTLVSTLATAAARAAEPGQWILVTTPTLRPLATPLIERRQQQGWQCDVVDSNTADLQADLQRRVLQQQVAANKNKDQHSTTNILFLGSWIGGADFKATSLPGTHGRMKGVLTDSSFGQPESDGSLTVAVGRLPARSAAEAQLMIAKLLAFETFKPEANQVNLIVAHPGGGSAFEKTIAENVIRSAVDQRLKRVDSSWQSQCIMDVRNSPHTVPSQQFGNRVKEMLEQPYLFCVYSGHSGPGGMYSTSGNVFGRSRFQTLKRTTPAGVLVSCGCYGCQVVEQRLGRPQQQGYGLSAIRSPHGPAAVIGAFGESYSAMGLLALDGLLSKTESAATSKTLGEYWLAIQHGVTRGEIKPGEFLLHDMADGSQGTVSLEKQRLEHAEMWTLLGDPAMRIPVISSTPK